MRRYVINRVIDSYDREKLQVCIIYPAAINRKQVAADNGLYSFEEDKLIFDKAENNWRYEKHDE